MQSRPAGQHPFAGQIRESRTSRGLEATLRSRCKICILPSHRTSSPVGSSIESRRSGAWSAGGFSAGYLMHRLGIAVVMQRHVLPQFGRVDLKNEAYPKKELRANLIISRFDSETQRN